MSKGGERLAEAVAAGRACAFAPKEVYHCLPGLGSVRLEGKVRKQRAGFISREMGDGATVLNGTKAPQHLDPAQMRHLYENLNARDLSRVTPRALATTSPARPEELFSKFPLAFAI